MAYRIDYGSAGSQRKTLQKNIPTPVIKTALLVLALVAGAIVMKVVGLTWIRDVLLPGDPEITAAALQNMTDHLRNGESLLDAVTTFCKEIIANAQ